MSQRHQQQCWGDNSKGQLGQGDKKMRGTSPEDMGNNLPTVPLGDFDAAAVYSGDEFSCAIDVNGDVKARGWYIITSYYIVSYRIVSYHIIWYRISWHHIIWYRIVSCRVKSYRIISYRVISYHIISHIMTSYHIVSYHIISHHTE